MASIPLERGVAEADAMSLRIRQKASASPASAKERSCWTSREDGKFGRRDIAQIIGGPSVEASLDTGKDRDVGKASAISVNAARRFPGETCASEGRNAVAAAAGGDAAAPMLIAMTPSRADIQGRSSRRRVASRNLKINSTSCSGSGTGDEWAGCRSQTIVRKIHVPEASDEID